MKRLSPTDPVPKIDPKPMKTQNAENTVRYGNMQ